MTKRQEAAQARAEEKQAIAMYLTGRYTLAQIKRKTSVDGWIVRGLVVAQTLGRFA
jgi:hypothetical protein